MESQFAGGGDLYVRLNFFTIPRSLKFYRLCLEGNLYVIVQLKGMVA
jgi:hypothetical protein